MHRLQIYSEKDLTSVIQKLTDKNKSIFKAVSNQICVLEKRRVTRRI
jgi:hypothetical protein